jgi:signal transduction histidine kinase
MFPVKSLFFPEITLPDNLRGKWKVRQRESYLISSNKALGAIGGLLLIHLICVDLPAKFEPLWLFCTVRISTAVLVLLAIVLGRRIHSLLWYKAPSIVALSALVFGQLLLMYFERQIPFFIAPVFLAVALVLMGLSLGFSFVAALVLFSCCAPMLTPILPLQSIPIAAQLISNFTIVIFVVIGLRSKIFQDLKIFQLNELTLELKAGLVQSEKLAALGTLSAGLAHEINNAMNRVSGGMRSLERYLKTTPSTKEKESFMEIFGAMKRGADITVDIVDNLRSYSRADNGNFTSFYLLEIINTVRSIFKAKITEAISVDIKVTPDLKIEASYAGMTQLISNLFSNAIDAFENKGGSIQIEAVSEKENWLLVIADTGQGISEENLKKIFDPFFTTKAVGKGTGLGLFVVKKEVDRHKGELSIETKVGVGTTFKIKFPYSLKGTEGDKK